MKTYELKKIDWVSFPDDVQYFTVKYRKTADPDTEINYTTVATSLMIDEDGYLPFPLYINSFADNTDYVVKFINNDNGQIFEDHVKSIRSYPLGNYVTKDDKAAPDCQFTLQYTGLMDSYLPSPKTGLLHHFTSKFTDLLGNFGNAMFTVLDENTGTSFEKRNGETGIVVTNNLTSLYANNTESNGNTETSLLGPSGERDYSIGIWVNFNSTEFVQTASEGKLWLWFAGNATNHIGVYIDSTTKKVCWRHKKDTVTEEIINDKPVEQGKWIKVICQRNWSTPSLNKVTLMMDGVTYNISTGSFSSATNYAGAGGNIYIGFGKNSSNTLVGTKGCFRYFYYRAAVIDSTSVSKLLDPPYPKVVIADLDGSNEYIITRENFVVLDNFRLTFVFPRTTVLGIKKVFARASDGDRTPKQVKIYPFIKYENTIDIDFSSGVPDDNFNAVAEHFVALTKGWGGQNGGVIPSNVYVHNNKLVLEAHGDDYDGSVQGVNKDSTLKYHTIEGDPKFGQIWTRRAGAVISSKAYLGFGRYLVRCKIPKNLGVAPAFWSFHYEEVYPENEALWNELVADGMHRQGSFNDGYYITRNHEIDIELPSHLAQGIFHTWQEVNDSINFYDVNPKYHIGITDDPDPNKNGLFRLVNLDFPKQYSSWVKVSNTVKRSYEPSFDNFKCNNWIGELSGGSGWAVQGEDYSGEEYLAQLTPIGKFVNDDEFHDFEYRWYKDRVDFYMDGVLITTNNKFVPDIPGKFTFGLWFPSGGYKEGEPWWPKPTSCWAGFPADWNYQKMIVERILFEPFDDATAGGTNRMIGETYPFEGYTYLVPTVEPDPDVNASPSVSAGSNKTVMVPATTTTLTGTATDPDGSVVSIEWTLVSAPAGTSVTIDTPDQLSTAIAGLTVEGVYIFKLTAIDNDGASKSSTVSVTVAYVPVTVELGNPIYTDQTSVTITPEVNVGSYPVSSYLWTQLSGTTATIVSPTAKDTVISGLTDGNYSFQLLVTTSDGYSVTDSISITVSEDIVVSPDNKIVIVGIGHSNMSGTAESGGDLPVANVVFEYDHYTTPGTNTIIEMTTSPYGDIKNSYKGSIFPAWATNLYNATSHKVVAVPWGKSGSAFVQTGNDWTNTGWYPQMKSDVNDCLSQVGVTRPHSILLMLGNNDMGNNDFTLSQKQSAITSLFDRLEADFPHTPIYVCQEVQHQYNVVPPEDTELARGQMKGYLLNEIANRPNVYLAGNMMSFIEWGKGTGGTQEGFSDLSTHLNKDSFTALAKIVANMSLSTETDKEVRQVWHLFKDNLTETIKEAIKTFVQACKTKGNWELLDMLQIYKNNTKNNAFMDYITLCSPENFGATHTTNQFVATAGNSSSYLKTHYIPASQYRKSSKDDFLFGFKVGNVTTTGNAFMAGSIGTSASIGLKKDSGNVIFYANDNSDTIVTGETGIASNTLYVIGRNGSDKTIYKDGTLVQTSNVASTALATNNIVMGGGWDGSTLNNPIAAEYVFSFYAKNTGFDLSGFITDITTLLTSIA
ncbi:MAG: hypothetical protein J0I41_00115 [Filimonas sp.]|nr:hypothetical protein [Filimonas sp.]